MSERVKMRGDKYIDHLTNALADEMYKVDPSHPINSYKIYARLAAEVLLHQTIDVSDLRTDGIEVGTTEYELIQLPSGKYDRKPK
jgi:hypothetical protein